MPDDNFLRTPTYPWDTLGETSTAYTTPAVNERDYTNFVTNHPDAVVYHHAVERWNAMQLRFVTDDDADAWAVDVFASRGEDYFTKICTLTLTGGTQVGPATSTDVSAVFVDTIVPSDVTWLTVPYTIDSGTDRIASYWFDMCGFDTFAFVATTAESGATLKIQGAGF